MMNSAWTYGHHKTCGCVVQPFAKHGWTYSPPKDVILDAGSQSRRHTGRTVPRRISTARALRVGLARAPPTN